MKNDDMIDDSQGAKEKNKKTEKPKITKVFGIKNELRAHQLKNELLTLDPNNFSCIEYFLSKFKTLRLLLEGVKFKKEDSNLIYCILTKLGPAYSVFVSTFHSTREAFISQGHDYKSPSFDSFCDSLIREQEKLLHLGLINLGNSSKKALASQQQPNSKNPKNLYPKRSGPKRNKGPKQFQPQNEKSFQQNKNKGKKTDRHCHFCNRDGHLESKCFKKMEALEVAMKNHNIHLEHSSTSTSSSGMALYACGCQASRSSYALNVSSSSHSHDWLIDYGASYHMAKNKAMFSSLNDCNTKNMVTGLPMVSCRDGVCSGCVLEKHDRDSFEKRASWHASAPLQLVHSYSCGPLPVVSFSGYKYFLTFIDDFSRHTWVYFLKLKIEVFNMFLAFKAFVEKQSGHQILKLRSDNGREYVNNKFINFCTENGIQMQHTVPCTPQQNGVVERKNRTLKEMANYVKGYRLIPLKSKNVIIRRYVKFSENILVYKPSLADVPNLSTSSTFENISSSDDESEDDKPPPPSQDPPSAPPLPKWVRATRDAAGDLVGDRTDQRRTHSQFDRASSLLAQASANYDPDTFAEASGHPDWDAAMNEEYHSLLANIHGILFLYQRDENLLDANGFTKPMNSIHLVLSLAASFKWEVHQLDVKSTFLHGDLHEEIYMEQPIGFIQIDSNLVCQLKKSLYGLKQASRAWYAKMDSFLLESGFSRCHSYNTVYTKKVGKSLIILVLYVYDLILTSHDPNLINHVKSSLKKKFEMTDLGHLHYFLGLQVLQSKEGISLSQYKYACDLLRHFHMEDCKPAPSTFQSGAKLLVTCTSPEVDATLYRQLVGKSLYLTHTRSDLSFVVGLVAQFMQNPRESHWKASKRILRYVRGTVQFRIHYSAKASPLLVGFTDSNWAGDSDDRKSTAEASKEALWLRQILSEFCFQQQHLTTLWCDKQSAIQLCKDPVQHQRSKHIELHMHFIRKLIHDHVLEVQYCSKDDQVADIFTKALTEAKFTKLRFMVGVQEVVTEGG
eukprot:PITA_19127